RAGGGSGPRPAREAVPPLLHAIAEAAVLAAGFRLGPGEEDLLARARAEAIRGLAVGEVDLDEGDARRHTETRSGGNAVDRRAHEVRPDRQRALGATEAMCLAAVVADPHGGEQCRCAAHEPRDARVRR